MNKIAAALIAFVALSVVPAGAGTFMRLAEPAAPPGQVRLASGDCRAIGQQVAAQHGGTLAGAHVENRGGRNVCVGTVVVPPRDGQRGKQIPFEVPM